MDDRVHVPVWFGRGIAAAGGLAYRLAVGLFFAMWSMGAAFVLYFGSGVSASTTWWLALASGAGLVPVLVAGRAILAMGLRSLSLRSYSIDTLIAGGVLGAILISVLQLRSEEHTSELQSLMRISYAVFCLNKKIYEKV